MDINFHYYATKVLAKAAAYTEADAQMIAEYCQFVNDFNTEPQEITEAITVPDFASNLIYSAQGKQMFYTVITQHKLLTAEQLKLSRIQKERLISFHFPQKSQIPEQEYAADSNNRVEYRTVPIDPAKPTTLWEKISSLSVEKGDQTLIYIGVLCHILGDSYGNQKFSGFGGWENSAHLWDSVNQINLENSTATHGISSLTIGHKCLGNAPDECFTAYAMRQRSAPRETVWSSYQINYNRNNPKAYLVPAKVIFDFLVKQKGDTVPSKEKWDSLSNMLYLSFLNQESNADLRTKFWKKQFPDEKFSYNASELSSIKSKNFFHFNHVADLIHINTDPYYKYPF